MVADALAVRDEYRLQSWTQVNRERQESGLTNKEFCAQRGIPEKIYYYWLRKVREAAAKAARSKLVRLEEDSSAEKRRRIEIRYGEAELKLPEDVDLKAVAILLNALIDLSRVTNYYVACGYTDLRLGIDGLAAIVMTQYGLELRRTACFCSAVDVRNGSGRCTGPETAMCYCISIWVTGVFSGREAKASFVSWSGSLFAG